jgi:AcrR family transcriptional regulator
MAIRDADQEIAERMARRRCLVMGRQHGRVVKSDAGMQRTRSAILDAAARVLGRRADAAIAEIADEAGVGRATLYRHFPTRESLLRGVAEAGMAELVEAFAAANLDELPADRAITRIIAVYLRNGAKYAAVIGQATSSATMTPSSARSGPSAKSSLAASATRCSATTCAPTPCWPCSPRSWNVPSG